MDACHADKQRPHAGWLILPFLVPPKIALLLSEGDDLRVDLDLDFKSACFGVEEKVWLA